MNQIITNSILCDISHPWDAATSIRREICRISSTNSNLFSWNLVALKRRGDRRHFWRQDTPSTRAGGSPTAISIAFGKPGVQGQPTISLPRGSAANDGINRWLCLAGVTRDSRHRRRLTNEWQITTRLRSNILQMPSGDASWPSQPVDGRRNPNLRSLPIARRGQAHGEVENSRNGRTNWKGSWKPHLQSHMKRTRVLEAIFPKMQRISDQMYRRPLNVFEWLLIYLSLPSTQISDLPEFLLLSCNSRSILSRNVCCFASEKTHCVVRNSISDCTSDNRSPSCWKFAHKSVIWTAGWNL
jgi:hypothetical protein